MRRTLTNPRPRTILLQIIVVVLGCCFVACSKKSDATQSSAASPTPTAATTAMPVAVVASPTALPAAEASPQAAATAPPSLPQPETRPRPEAPPLVLPAGTALKVRTSSTLSTKSAQTGERFVASLESPLMVTGKVVAKAGAAVNGSVVNSDPGGRVKGVALISVQLTSLALANGKSVAISTNVIERQAKSTKGKDAKRIGIGAGAGGLIGGIAGGGKGAAIGAGVGGRRDGDDVGYSRRPGGDPGPVTA